MITTALSYQSNQYCNHCFNERADSTQKQDLNTFEFMGEKIQLNPLTPKEKAAELVDKFRNYIISFLSDTMKDKNAKTCALILADEISSIMYKAGNRKEFTKGYWKEVKQEIEKL